MHVDTPEQAKIRAARGFICNWTGGHCPRGCVSACTYEVIDARTDEVIARNDLNSAQPTVEHPSTHSLMPRIPKRTLIPGNQRQPEPIRAAHPAVRVLWEMLRDRPDLTVKGIARKSGLSAEAIRGWRRGVSPRLADVEAVLNAMGLRLAIIDVDSFQ